MWISFAVTAAVPGYCTCQNHWWPVTSTFSRVEPAGGADTAGMTWSTKPSRTASSTTGATNPPPITTMYGPLSSCETTPLRLRTNASTSRAMTARNTTIAPANMAHQSVSISLACGVAGLVTD